MNMISAHQSFSNTQSKSVWGVSFKFSTISNKPKVKEVKESKMKCNLKLPVTCPPMRIMILQLNARSSQASWCQSSQASWYRSGGVDVLRVHCGV
jgi:hypothetical protein